MVLIKANLLDRDLGSGVWELGAGSWDLGFGLGCWALGLFGLFFILFYFIFEIGLEIGLGIRVQDLGHVGCFSGWSGVAGMDGCWSVRCKALRFNRKV